MTSVQHFVTSPFLTVYERDGSSLDMPLDDPVLGPNLIVEGAGLEIEFNYLALVQHAERLRHGDKAVSFTEIAIGGFHRIFEVTFDSSGPLIARISLPLSSNPLVRPTGWDSSKMKGEIAILRFIAERAPRVPVPRVVASDTRAGQEGNEVGAPWMLLEKVPGVQLCRVYNNLSFADKKAIVSDLAEILAAVFELRASALGSAIGLDETANPVLGSVVISTEPASSVCLGPGKFSLYDILEKRVAVRIETCPPAEHSAARPFTDYFRKTLQVLNEELSTSEFHLTHLDLRMANIFVIPGLDGLPKVSGILDWEFHAFLPPKLATRFPEWLLYEGFFDPRFNPVGSSFSWTWEESPITAEELRSVFLATIRKCQRAMFSAYQDGALARQIFFWLDHWSDDAGYRSGLSAWIQHVDRLGLRHSM